MSEHSRPYAIHSNEECERLELQARLANIEGHLRHLPVSPGDRVLDAGCGSGAISRLIARTYPRADVVGVDLREQYLDFARIRARAENFQNVTFRAADVFDLPFPAATFDVVWTKYLLQWLKEPERALKELKRVTRPGGIIVSCDFAGFAVEHFPATHEFIRHAQLQLLARRVFAKPKTRKVTPRAMRPIHTSSKSGVSQDQPRDQLFNPSCRSDYALMYRCPLFQRCPGFPFRSASKPDWDWDCVLSWCCQCPLQ
jgi:ubiquinone/menaquinone biosynthesis C-methylase UbiE